jgi:hypothetical protein
VWMGSEWWSAEAWSHRLGKGGRHRHDGLLCSLPLSGMWRPDSHSYFVARDRADTAILLCQGN